MRDVLQVVTRPLSSDLRASVEARYDDELAELTQTSNKGTFRTEDGRWLFREEFTPQEWRGEVLSCFAMALSNTDRMDFSSPYGEDGLPSGLNWYLCYWLDWKQTTSPEWQTLAIARQLGLPLMPEEVSDRPFVSEGLPLADSLFRPFGYALLFIDTNGDDYVVVPVRLEWMGEAKRLVQEAGFRAWSYSEDRP